MVKNDEKAYRMLEDDGIVATESGVDGGDILIGKTSPHQALII